MTIQKQLSRFGSPAWLLLAIALWKVLSILDTALTGFALMDSIEKLLSRDILIMLLAVGLLILVIIWPELAKKLHLSSRGSDSITEMQTKLRPFLLLNEEKIAEYVRKLDKLQE